MRADWTAEIDKLMDSCDICRAGSPHLHPAFDIDWYLVCCPDCYFSGRAAQHTAQRAGMKRWNDGR